MSYETEKAERGVRLFSMIMGVVIFITMLSFFGIIDFRTNYCDVPSGFDCKGLFVTPTSVTFTIENNVAEFKSILIQLKGHTGCTTFKQGLVKGGTFMTVNLVCSVTEGQGKVFKDTISITYEPQNSYFPKTVEGKLRAKVGRT